MFSKKYIYLYFDRLGSREGQWVQNSNLNSNFRYLLEYQANVSAVNNIDIYSLFEIFSQKFVKTEHSNVYVVFWQNFLQFKNYFQVPPWIPSQCVSCQQWWWTGHRYIRVRRNGRAPSERNWQTGYQLWWIAKHRGTVDAWRCQILA